MMMFPQKCLFFLCLMGFLSPSYQAAITQQITRQIFQDIYSLDPAHLSYALGDEEIMGDLLEGLYSYDATGKPVLGTAVSAKRLNATEWLFQLRPTAKWSDGKPVTAHDFVFAWKRMLDPHTACRRPDMLYCLKNACSIAQKKQSIDALGVKALAEDQLWICTEKPEAALAEKLAHVLMAPLPRHHLLQHPQTWMLSSQYLSNGPFMIQQHLFQHSIGLKKNPYYWDCAQVALDKVVYCLISNEYTGYQLYQRGQLDLLELEQLRGLPASHQYRIFSYADILFNHRDKQLDQKTRKSLSLAINREELMQVLHYPGSSLYSLYPEPMVSSIYVYEWKDWPMRQRLHLARQLLEQQGFSSKHPLVLKLDTNNTDLTKTGLLYLKYSLERDLPVQINLEIKNSSALNHVRSQGDFQLITLGWKGWRFEHHDPIQILQVWQTGHLYNDGRYSHPAIDRWLSNSKIDNSLLYVMQKKLLQDYCVIRLFQHSRHMLVKPSIQGFVPNAFCRHPSKHMMVAHAS